MKTNVTMMSDGIRTVGECRHLFVAGGYAN